MTKPMCEIDEYAISFFMSVCTSATRPMYTTAISDSAMTKPASAWLASGTIGSESRMKAVAAELQHDGGQHHRAAGGRLHVRVRQPGVHRPHRHLHGEGQHEAPGIPAPAGSCRA